MDLYNDKTFYTATMARLLTQQGRYLRAAEVYRYLLHHQPDRRDLKDALDKLVPLISTGIEKWGSVTDLIERWVMLTLRYRALRRLQRLSISITKSEPLDE